MAFRYDHYYFRRPLWDRHPESGHWLIEDDAPGSLRRASRSLRGSHSILPRHRSQGEGSDFSLVVIHHAWSRSFEVSGRGNRGARYVDNGQQDRRIITDHGATGGEAINTSRLARASFKVAVWWDCNIFEGWIKKVKRRKSRYLINGTITGKWRPLTESVVWAKVLSISCGKFG